MNRFKQLQVRRAALVQEAKNLLAKENPSAEETERATAILKAESGEIAVIDAQLTEFAALFEAERTAPAAAVRQPASGGTPEDPEVKDPKRGFRDMAEFALAVRKAGPGPAHPGVDPRLLNLADRQPHNVGAAPTGFMEEGGAVGEGYLVPPEMRSEIWKLIFGAEGILEFLQPEPTGSNQVKFTKDETTPWGATGVQAVWVDAGEQLTKSTHAHKQGMNQLFRLAAYVLVTDELEEDAPNLSSKLTVGAAGAINWKAEEACMWGDGVGKPLGWMGSGALVTQTKEGSQVAATIVTKNISKMFSRCLNPTLAKWFCSKDTLPQIMELTIGNQPVWTPPNSGFANAPGGFLLGRPIAFSRHCQVLGTKGDIQIVDPTGYLLNVKTGGIKFASSIHLFFDYAVNAYRWMFRIGGTPILSAAVSPAKGSNTESHFVTLETRA
jgi:HK97 family phage major capsid protein